MKPAGLSRQTAKHVEEDEEEEVRSSPVQLGISIAALLVVLFFLYTAYTADQTPNRTSAYLFGDPAAQASASDSGDDGSASEEESSEEEEE